MKLLVNGRTGINALGMIAAGAAALLVGCSSTPTGTTSDTLGSTTNGVSKFVSSTTPDSKKSAFVNDRFEAIRFESAKGEGENVEALAALLGEQDRKAFASWMKTNYQPLFAELKKPDELLTRIQQRRGISG